MSGYFRATVSGKTEKDGYAYLIDLAKSYGFDVSEKDIPENADDTKLVTSGLILEDDEFPEEEVVQPVENKSYWIDFEHDGITLTLEVPYADSKEDAESILYAIRKSGEIYEEVN